MRNETLQMEKAKTVLGNPLLSFFGFTRLRDAEQTTTDDFIVFLYISDSFIFKFSYVKNKKIGNATEN